MSTATDAGFPNPLLELHRQIEEAEFQPYDRLEIVSTFGQPQAEYGALRKGCGLIDLPQRGVLELTGKDRLPFLNNLLSNQTWNKSTKTGLAAGDGAYAFFLNLRGRIVADVNVLELGDRTWVEADVRKVELLRSAWDRYLFTEQVKLASRVGQLHELALHGLAAREVLARVLGSDMPDLKPLASTTRRAFDADVVVWRDDVCGVPGYHLILPTAEVARVWAELLTRFAQPAELGKRVIRPVGWAAFNAARVEAGRAVLDIDFPGAVPDRPGAKLNPAEAEAAASPDAAPGGAGAVGVLPAELGPVAFARGIDLGKCYLGQEVVARMHARKQVARMICGVRMDTDALPIAGAKVLDPNGNEVGVVTSSTVSPVLSNAAVCLAYVKRPFFEIGKKLTIPAEGEMRSGTVVELPFLRVESPTGVS